MVEDIEYFEKKRADRTYISKPFSKAEDDPRKLRIVSKVFDSATTHQFGKIKEELVLRVTEGQRQEVKAVFYEDNRSINSLTIQRYTRKNGNPHKTSFTFTGDEIRNLYQLIRLITRVHLDGHEKERLDDDILEDIITTVDQKRRFLIGNPDLVMEIARNEITESDVVALAYRKAQLEIFDRLLNDRDFFAVKREEWQKRGDEAVWQQFFEDNPWIFGYGLQYVFTASLPDRRLEQVVAGASVFGKGKRVDALLKTLGAISSLCFVELKTHHAPLLTAKEYRGECWPISDELAGAVAQAQKTVRKAVETINDKWQVITEDGTPTGETAYLIHPKSFVVIGNLREFLEDHGVNERKFSSFELFRGNMVSPEVLTFDELFERARCIVQYSEAERQSFDAKDEQLGNPEEKDVEDVSPDPDHEEWPF